MKGLLACFSCAFAPVLLGAVDARYSRRAAGKDLTGLYAAACPEPAAAAPGRGGRGPRPNQAQH